MAFQSKDYTNKRKLCSLQKIDNSKYYYAYIKAKTFENFEFNIKSDKKIALKNIKFIYGMPI